MTLETKFGIGDRVFLIGHSDVYRVRNCKTCDHTGKVTISGEQFICPNCSGRSAHRQYSGQAWYVHSFKTRIGKVGVEVNIDETWRMSSHGSRPGCAYDSHTVKVTYMVEETGIGSGTVWSEDTAFATQTEAQAECDERNKYNLRNEDGAVLQAETM